MSGRRGLVVVAVGALLAAGAACGGDDGQSSANGSAAMPVADEGEFGGGGFGVDGGGRLDVAGEACWTLDGAMVAWAPGSILDDDTRSVTTPEGEPVVAGSYVRFTGREFTRERWPGSDEGRWAEHAEACGVTGRLLVFVDSVAIDPFDPRVASDDDLVAAASAAQLDSDGGCGYGFTASNDDGTVGLIVSTPGRDGPASGELPDESYSVALRVGSRLFDQWCTDILEPFLDPFVAAEWPITSGRFEFDSSDDFVARFVLTDAVVSTPAGQITLDEVVMENSCYGCFPG